MSLFLGEGLVEDGSPGRRRNDLVNTLPAQALLDLLDVVEFQNLLRVSDERNAEEEVGLALYFELGFLHKTFPFRLVLLLPRLRFFRHEVYFSAKIVVKYLFQLVEVLDAFDNPVLFSLSDFSD